MLIVAQLSLYSLRSHAYAGTLYGYVHITFPVIETKISLYSTHLFFFYRSWLLTAFSFCVKFFVLFHLVHNILNDCIVSGIPHPNQLEQSCRTSSSQRLACRASRHHSDGHLLGVLDTSIRLRHPQPKRHDWYRRSQPPGRIS